MISLLRMEKARAIVEIKGIGDYGQVNFSFSSHKNRNPLIFTKDCDIFLILNINYSIIEATRPEPTVRPPSRLL